MEDNNWYLQQIANQLIQMRNVMHYYKILRENKTHHGLVYKEGLNVDPIPFNPSGSCLSGGIYFAEKDILAFLWAGPLICEVTLPEDARVYKNPGKPEKWKADKVILGPFKKINLAVIKKLVKEGADIHTDSGYTLQWASKNGHFNIVKYLVKSGADTHANNNYALRLASGNGHLNVVKYLVENGADVHTGNDHALRWASINNHFSVVKYLVENGADVHADNDYALRWASEDGHFNIVKYLVENGADVHADNDYALQWASAHDHLNVVKYLKSLS